MLSLTYNYVQVQTLELLLLESAKMCVIYTALSQND